MCCWDGKHGDAPILEKLKQFNILSCSFCICVNGFARIFFFLFCKFGLLFKELSFNLNLYCRCEGNCLCPSCSIYSPTCNIYFLSFAVQSTFFISIILDKVCVTRHFVVPLARTLPHTHSLTHNIHALSFFLSFFPPFLLLLFIYLYFFFVETLLPLFSCSLLPIDSTAWWRHSGEDLRLLKLTWAGVFLWCVN